MFLLRPGLRLIQRRTVWCPTLLGSFCIIALLIVSVAWWCSSGELFLRTTQRLPAEVLVIEGWIGRDGVRAAGQEFEQHGYQYIVTTGGWNIERWGQDRSSYAETAERELIRAGIPKDKIIVAPAKDSDSQRTYESAIAVWRALQARGIQPKSLNVFTLGAHARRSRMVFAKVYRGKMRVGVIDWTPSSYETSPWWRSSERAKQLLTETAGYLFEALLDSGRGLNSPAEAASSDLVRYAR